MTLVPGINRLTLCLVNTLLPVPLLTPALHIAHCTRVKWSSVLTRRLLIKACLLFNEKWYKICKKGWTI